jgi:sarcosine oxidase subunit gamma
MTRKEPVVMADSTQSDVRVRAATHRRSAASHLFPDISEGIADSGEAVFLRHIPFVGQIGIRVVQGTTGAQAIESVLNARLPARSGDVSPANAGRLIWLSPDEFLYFTDPDAGGVQDVSDVVADLVSALGDEPGSVIDLSANRVVLELAGPSARDVLEAGCALDLHPRVFTAPSALQTAIGPVPVILWKVGDERYFIVPRSSFADYLVGWLQDAMDGHVSGGVC